MTASSSPDTATTADWARPLYAGQIGMLGELAEAGMQIARAVKDQPDNDPGQTALAFGRAARAVRLTVMLQARLITALEAWKAHRDYCVSSTAREQRREIQGRIERIVERVAGDQCDDAGEVESLVQDAAERLDDEDLCGDLLSRPLSEAVATICRDLGLDPDWPALAQEAWAREEASGGAAGWPLAGLAPPPDPVTVIQARFRLSG